MVAKQHKWKSNPKPLNSFHGFNRFGNKLLINISPQSCNYTLAEVCLHSSNVNPAAGQYSRSLTRSLWLRQIFIVTKGLVKTLCGSERDLCLSPSLLVCGGADCTALLGCLPWVQNGIPFIRHPVPLQLAENGKFPWIYTCSVINVSPHNPHNFNWQWMCEHSRAAKPQILWPFHVPHIYYYWTGLDWRKVHVQFKASCLERSVHSWYGVPKKLSYFTLTLSLFSLFLYMHISVRGWISSCGINLFIFKNAVLRMQEHSSLLLWLHTEASLEDSNRTCQMDLFQQWTLAINCLSVVRPEQPRTELLWVRGSSPVIFCWSIDN